MVRAVTGWDVTVEELLIVGERRLNMMRAFNAREGINRKQDMLTEKFFSTWSSDPFVFTLNSVPKPAPP